VINLMTNQPKLRNVFLTDENVDGPIIRLARAKGVEIIRDVDTDIPCDIDHYDQCLFDYAIEHNYVIVTANIRDFEPKFYKYAETGKDQPGIVFITSKNLHNHFEVAEWLAELQFEDLANWIWRI
jgi:hypothetical protein